MKNRMEFNEEKRWKLFDQLKSQHKSARVKSGACTGINIVISSRDSII